MLTEPCPFHVDELSLTSHNDDHWEQADRANGGDRIVLVSLIDCEKDGSLEQSKLFIDNRDLGVLCRPEHSTCVNTPESAKHSCNHPVSGSAAEEICGRCGSILCPSLILSLRRAFVFEDSANIQSLRCSGNGLCQSGMFHHKAFEAFLCKGVCDVLWQQNFASCCKFQEHISRCFVRRISRTGQVALATCQFK